MDQQVFAEPHISNEMFDENVSQKALNRRDRKQAKRDKKGVSHQSKPFEPLNQTQVELMGLLRDPEVSQIFAIGPAGTGKTYVPTRYAVRDLIKGLSGNGPYKKLYIARPTVSNQRHRVGFLPGKLDQKLAPWLRPIIRAICDEVKPVQLEKWKQEGIVQFLSFEHMRGDTFDDGYVILDEAQNCSLSDLKLFLTRKGQNSRYMIAGDVGQADDMPDSGLQTVIDMIEEHNMSPEIIEFTEEEVIRSEDAKEWVTAFGSLDRASIQ